MIFEAAVYKRFDNRVDVVSRADREKRDNVADDCADACFEALISS